MRALIIVIELSLFSGFTWALVCWFRDSRNVRRWELTYIKTGGLLFMISHLACACLHSLPSFPVSIIGILLRLISGGLFGAALLSFQKPPGVAFSDHLVVDLNTSGPYRFIRHPFYTAYSLAWIGGTVATGCWWLFISFLVMGPIYYKAAKEEERLWLQSRDVKQYESYIGKTGMFIIKL
jgi:protein-S-isoprenylcysteine O-methyltransferase Ste14